MFEPKPSSFWSRKPGDIIPVWNVVIWEDLDETSKFTTIKFKGGYEDAVDYAKAKLNYYKTYPYFSISHFTIE